MLAVDVVALAADGLASELVELPVADAVAEVLRAALVVVLLAVVLVVVTAAVEVEVVEVLNVDTCDN